MEQRRIYYTPEFSKLWKKLPKEIKEKMWAHAGEAHPDLASSMTEEQKTQMNEKMDSLLA